MSTLHAEPTNNRSDHLQAVPTCTDPTDPLQAGVALRHSLLFWMQRAEDHFQTLYPLPEIDLSLRGRCAGQAYLQAWRLRFNSGLLADNYSHFMQNVVPHELAHLIAFREYGTKIRPHGREWKQVMEQVFGVPAKVTHEYDIRNSARQHYHYRCACQSREHRLTIRRHNRISKGMRYVCKFCRSELVFVGHTTD